MKSLHITSKLINNMLRKTAWRLSILIMLCITSLSYQAQSQIWEPEGLNMPGEWNEWTNPPVNNLALASSTQVTNGRITKISTGIPRYQTIFSVDATAADLVGGTYNWLFTSGPEGNAFANKWAGVNTDENVLQTYLYQGADDNNLTLLNGFWYTMNWEDSGYGNTRAIFMPTSNEPVQLLTVSEPAGPVEANQAVAVTLTINQVKSAEEFLYLRYTTNAWNSSSLLLFNMSGTSGTATIPGQPEGTNVSYYAFSSTVDDIAADYDLFSIRLNNNDNENYGYIVEGTAPSVIGWANLQWPPDGNIVPAQDFDVFAQVFADGITGGAGQGADIQAWIGYSDANTNPNTWTNWIVADYQGDVGNNDEYMANLGAELTLEGTYYYASRFQLADQDFVYGGYAAGGGGFWDGTTNVSGVLEVNAIPPDAVITYANLQWPPEATIALGAEVNVYGQVLADNVELGDEGYLGLQVWVGYNDSDTDPALWTNWFEADYLGVSGLTDRPEYAVAIGADIAAEGTYYYATRFQLGEQIEHGGYADPDGGIWDGVTNVSGVLTVEDTDPEIAWANLQWPADGEIEVGQDFDVYAQVFAAGITEGAGQGAGIQAWIGYSSSNSNPSGWTNWVAAVFNDDVGDNDEYTTNLGPAITETGTYYYASRFQLDDQDFVYGGFSPEGGGFWDGTTNISGVLIVSEEVVEPDFDWVNLQYPGSGTIQPGDDFDVYAQAFIEGLTGPDGPADGVEAMIGFSTENTEPASWDEWFDANYVAAAGANDEFMTNLGASISEVGTYYYASRFSLNGGDWYYGGYSTSGGGFWDGTTHVSGVLIVEEEQPDPEIDWANLQWPGSGEIEPGDPFDVYAQAYIDGITGGDEPAEGLEAWIGYSTSNTNPNTWSDWVNATHIGPDGDNDEFMAEIGLMIAEEGTYYYASRFRLNEGTYVYGGFSDEGGGFWNGVTHISGVLTIETVIPDPVIEWANLQHPASGDVFLNQVFNVYGRVFVPGITGIGIVNPALLGWIGYSSDNSDPATWDNWIPATFNGAVGSNDEFRVNLGAHISEEGTYYYATRFQFNEGEFVYGGYSEDGGDFWDGEDYVSGMLTVSLSPDTWPVTFTLIDATELHTNVKFKGDMTEWEAVPMIEGPDYTWTITLQVAPGSYEWGAVEDDGTALGLWLIAEPGNLEMAVDEFGVVSGTTTYTTTITSLSENTLKGLLLYPNPVFDQLNVIAHVPVMLRLSDLNGQTLLFEQNNDTNHQIDLSKVPSGIYMLEIIGEKAVVVKRVVKR